MTNFIFHFIDNHISVKKTLYQGLKSVLFSTLIVVFICGCGKDTAHYISSEERTEQNADTEVKNDADSGITDTQMDNDTDNSTENSKTEDSSHLTDKEQSDSQNSEEEYLIYIYICGEVQVPGVYTLREGSRVYDAIWAAGGFTEEAATDYWNQAMLLTDSEMIYVPTKEEAKDRTPLSALESNNNNSVSATDIETESTTGHKININTASKEELMEIPGVGESRALSILAYREEHGNFSTIEEIKEVSGIKDGVFQKMKEYIVTD